jgi:serine/threonine protein kinase
MSDAEPSPDPKPAPRLGSYLLSKQLGSGGMSNVFRAVHEETGNVVAVKVLPRSLAKNVTLLQRFMREAKSAEALDHPNIVAIYDRGFDQGRHYLVLEYVEGRDLHDRVRLNGPLEQDEAVRFIREVAEGLRYASSQGMIHRDVKPANLLMTPEGHAKIIDLGLALQTEDEDERVTRDGTTVGTVDYMAPEQARDSRQTSERSDIYSLGCTYYYLLTGSQPYPGGGLADKLARHYKAPIPDVRATRPELSESLSLLIRRMMEKKPERRFADYTQLIEAIDALSDPSSSASRSPAILDAVIVDDDEDEGEAIGLEPTETAMTPDRGKPGDRPPSTRDYMMAEIVDDDDDDDDDDLDVLKPPKSRTQPTRREPPSRPEISLADLAALDSDGEISNRRQGRRLTTPAAAPSTPRLDVPALDDLEHHEPVEGSATGVRRSSGPELSLKTWIAAGIMVGLAIAIVGFGASMVISMAKPRPPEVVTKPEPEPVTEPTPTVVYTKPRTNTTGPVRPIPKPKEAVIPPTPPKGLGGSTRSPVPLQGSLGGRPSPGGGPKVARSRRGDSVFDAGRRLQPGR